jgi:hypothetical protein
MKKRILPLAFTTILLMGSFIIASAQVRLNVNVNIGPRPAWGLPGNPAGNFYYFPEIDCYYNIPQQRFVYLDRGRWVYVRDLPRAYRGFDLYRGQKVIITDNDPFSRAQFYRERYGRNYVAYRPPVVIVDKRRGYDKHDHDRGRGRGRW